MVDLFSTLVDLCVSGVTEEGVVVDELVELVDLFPTLVDLAGFPADALPRCRPDGGKDEPLCHEGASMVPLFTSPTSAIKTNTFSDELHPSTDKERSVIGKSIMDKGYRYTLRVEYDNDMPTWDDVIDEELYDHTVDKAETINMANDDSYSHVKAKMRAKLVEGWRNALVTG